MKTFLVKEQNETVVVNFKSYYYNNIISIDDNDKELLDYCEFLVEQGKLDNYSFYTETKKEKESKTKLEEKKSEDKKSNSKKSEDKTKTTKSKTKTTNKNKKEEK